MREREITILFDACIGKPVMDHIAGLFSLLGFPIRLLHSSEFFREGTGDEELVRRAKSEGWVVITADQARRGRKEVKMPLVCRRTGVTHIVMTSTLHELDSIRKVEAILKISDLFSHIAAQPRGRRFKLQATSAGGIRLYDADLKRYVSPTTDRRINES